MIKIDESTFLLIVNEYYNSNISLITLGEKYGISNTALQERMKRRGLERKDKYKRNRKYQCDENFFEQIDTQEKAYILGFLYADGYVNEKKNSVYLSLQERDKDILEKINNCIQSRPLIFVVHKKERQYPMYRMVVCSKKVVEDLKRHGCFQAKTYTLQFPTTVSDELMPHFIRGYMDGDGCISKSLTLPSVSFIGSKYMILSLRDFVKTTLGIHMTTFEQKTKYNNGITNSIINGGKQVRKFLDYLYKDSTIFLERKHNRYLSLKNRYEEFSKIRICSVENCENKHSGRGYCEKHYREFIVRNKNENVSI